MIGVKSTLADIAFIVCSALDRVSITAVLTGGSAATYYAPDAYQSRDLDFVLAVHAAGGAAELRKLGFTESGQVYRHPDTHFTIDFPHGPLAVGGELITSWRTDRRAGELLHVLTPTDCVRDRLASFLFWNDFSGLEQALAVARTQRRKLELAKVEGWCRKEGHPGKFELFKSRLRQCQY